MRERGEFVDSVERCKVDVSGEVLERREYGGNVVSGVGFRVEAKEEGGRVGEFEGEGCG